MKKRSVMIVAVAALLIGGLLATPAMAIDWQQFKGVKLNVLGLEQAQAAGLKQLIPNSRPSPALKWKSPP